jgi:hypothetical protein
MSLSQLFFLLLSSIKVDLPVFSDLDWLSVYEYLIVKSWGVLYIYIETGS